MLSQWLAKVSNVCRRDLTYHDLKHLNIIRRIHCDQNYTRVTISYTQHSAVKDLGLGKQLLVGCGVLIFSFVLLRKQPGLDVGMV